jgi:hypothetical protein
VFIIGPAADTSSDGRSGQEIAAALCRHLEHSEEELLSATDALAGRFVVIFRGESGSLRLVGDACGTRPIAYAASGGIAAMHAKLVADNLGGASGVPLRSRYRWGYPGAGTPYDGVRLLLPNTVLGFESGEVRRFFPRGLIQPISTGEAAEEITQRLVRCLGTVAASGPLVLSLTAGQDSRATLSAIISGGIMTEAFTYVTQDPSTRADAEIAEAISREFGIAHTVITVGVDTPLRASFDWVLRRNTFGCHGYRVYQEIWEHYRDRQVAHIRSNLVEVGRAFWGQRREDVRSGTGMADLFIRLQKRNISPEECVDVKSLFDDFIMASGFPGPESGIDLRQLFYWEHRMGSWLSQVIIEGDPAFETVIPWNCRRILECLLAVPWEEQRAATVIKSMTRLHGLDAFP